MIVLKQSLPEATKESDAMEVTASGPKLAPCKKGGGAECKQKSETEA